MPFRKPGTNSQQALTQALGTPESGYGPGGVDNPAYRGSGQPTSGTLPIGTGAAWHQPQGGWDTPQGREQIKIWGRGVLGGQPTVGSGLGENQGQTGHITQGRTRPTGPPTQIQNPPPAGGVVNGPAQGGLGQFQTSGQGLGMDGLNGFDARNFADPQMQSVKYRFARLAQKAGARTPQQMAALVLSPEFQREFPGATFNGKDVVNFNGALSDGPRGGVPVGEVDVLQAADRDANTANGIWWGPIEAGGNVVGGGGMASGVPDSSGLPMQLAQQFFSGDNQNLQLMELLKLLQSGNATQGFY